MNGKSTYCFIVNTASNSHRAQYFFKARETELAQDFPEAEFVYITAEDAIAEIVADKAAKFTHIVACGGDGTVNQVAAGILKSGSEAVMGVIPLGSGNDFSKSIGLSKDINSNLDVLKADQVWEIDVVEVNGQFFINTFGIGVDGLTNFHASQLSIKNGSLRYFIAGIKALLQSRPFMADISIPNKDLNINRQLWMATVANGKVEGGKYKISPTSINDDGVLELVLVRSISRIRLIIEFLKLSIGLPFDKNVVQVYQVEETCTIHTDREINAHADGEQVSEQSSFRFKLHPSALKIVGQK